MKKTFTYIHGLSQEAAYTKISQLIPGLEKQYKDKIEYSSWKWNSKRNKMNFDLTIKGKTLSGVLHLAGNEIIINADVPFIVSLYWDKVKTMIRQKIRDLLG